MTKVYITAAQKGGIGKSTVSSSLCQYFERNNIDYVAYDADPKNKTLAALQGINVEVLPLIDEDHHVQRDRLDDFINLMADGSKENIVLDVGSNIYDVFMETMLDADFFNALTEIGHEFIYNAILSPANNEMEILRSISTWYESTPAKFLIWKNFYKGKFQIIKDGKETDFYSSKLGSAMKKSGRVIGEIELVERDPKTFIKAYQDITRSGYTMASALSSADLKFAERLRVKTLYDQTMEAINSILGVPDGEQ